MPNIRIFGCSFTQGIENLDRYGSNWVHRFIDKLNNNKTEIYSYAQAGTGVMWHSYIFSQVKKTYPDDIYICQITNHGRYAWWKEPENYLEEYKDYDIFYNNLFYKTINLRKNLHETLLNSNNVKMFNYGVVFHQHDNTHLKSDDLEFAKNYYQRSNELNNWAIGARYLIDNCDLAYFHHECTMNDYKTIFGNNVYIPTSIETQMGSDKFKSHIIDDGDHFNDEGNKKVAQFVYDNIKDKIKDKL